MNSSSYSLQSVRKLALQFSCVAYTFNCQKTATKIAVGDKNSLQSSLFSHKKSATLLHWPACIHMYLF